MVLTNTSKYTYVCWQGIYAEIRSYLFIIVGIYTMLLLFALACMKVLTLYKSVLVRREVTNVDFSFFHCQYLGHFWSTFIIDLTSCSCFQGYFVLDINNMYCWTLHLKMFRTSHYFKAFIIGSVGRTDIISWRIWWIFLTWRKFLKFYKK